MHEGHGFAVSHVSTVLGEVNQALFFRTGYYGDKGLRKVHGSGGDNSWPAVAVRYQQASKKKLDEYQEEVLVLVVLELLHPLSLQETHHIIFGLGYVVAVEYNYTLCVPLDDKALTTPNKVVVFRDGEVASLDLRGVFNQFCQELEQFLARLEKVGALIPPEGVDVEHIHGGHASAEEPFNFGDDTVLEALLVFAFRRPGKNLSGLSMLDVRRAFFFHARHWSRRRCMQLSHLRA